MPLAVSLLAAGVVGGTIGWSTAVLRAHWRADLAGHDGEVLQAVARLRQWEDQANGDALGPPEDPGEQLELGLKISRLPGVVGLRLFSPAGEFLNSFPVQMPEASLSPEDLATLRGLRPASHFRPDASLAAVDLAADLAAPAGGGRGVPLLEVNVPLQAPDAPRLVGVVQFTLDAQDLAAQYARLDRRLAGRAVAEFAVAAGVLVLGLQVAFGRLRRTQTALAAQAARLRQVNQELALAAKTAAVGAVTSHLIHGLKSPLSGLRGFVQSHAAGGAADSPDDWRDALASTERMQALIAGVVRVLEDQQAVGSYEVSLRELGEIVMARLLPVARAAGVHLHRRIQADGLLGNRDANLAILILENLIQNALQATAEGRAVQLVIHGAGAQVRCEVHDQGPGFPPTQLPHLFQPGRSTKTGGSGLGLAISRQLARNLGGELELTRTTPAGCVFCLALPQKILLPALLAADQLSD